MHTEIKSWNRADGFHSLPSFIISYAAIFSTVSFIRPQMRINKTSNWPLDHFATIDYAITTGIHKHK